MYSFQAPASAASHIQPPRTAFGSPHSARFEPSLATAQNATSDCWKRRRKAAASGIAVRSASLSPYTTRRRSLSRSSRTANVFLLPVAGSTNATDRSEIAHSLSMRTSCAVRRDRSRRKSRKDVSATAAEPIRSAPDSSVSSPLEMSGAKTAKNARRPKSWMRRGSLWFRFAYRSLASLRKERKLRRSKSLPLTRSNLLPSSWLRRAIAPARPARAVLRSGA
mmetsp:Transcript_56529/g.134299  ORF Transcript_56529/g.134299 Transcript_56529/m.134299 type:complete len:222 (-) Transcript_56529:184-849(-)